jgi:thiosulfate dehydrogenase [quinone] large subunit
MANLFSGSYGSIVGDAPPWVLLTRLFFGLGWLRAATEKLIDPYWWNGAGIQTFLVDHDDSRLAWYRPFVDHVIEPHLDTVVVLVVALQLAAGLALLRGRNPGAALAAGIFLNINFVAVGAVSPSAFYLVAQGALVLWLVEQRPEPVYRRALLGGTCLLILIGLVGTPLIRTLQPAEVIDDPAMMLLVLGSLSAVATVETVRRHQRPPTPSRPREAGPARIAAGVLEHRR